MCPADRTPNQNPDHQVISRVVRDLLLLEEKRAPPGGWHQLARALVAASPSAEALVTEIVLFRLWFAAELVVALARRGGRGARLWGRFAGGGGVGARTRKIAAPPDATSTSRAATPTSVSPRSERRTAH